MPRPGGLDEYDVLYKIGSGSYGTCKKIRRKKDGKLLVWKEMDYGQMSESEKTMLVSEVNLLRELKHPYIVRYYDRIIDRTNTTLYIIMEYCESGDLGSLIQQHRKEQTFVPEDFVWKIFAQVTSALKECHRRKESGQVVLHRDIKPQNCFLDRSRNVKLGDFGLARVLQHDTSFAKTFVGSPYYISPELWNNNKYNEKTDIWSLGCLIYELCALRPPFLATSQKELATKIRSGKFSRIPSQYSDDLDLVIRTMLRVNEERRPSIENLMEHPKIDERLRVLQSPPKSKSPSSERKSELRKLEASLNEKEKQLMDREKEIESRMKRLSEIESREKELARKEEALKHREAELAAREHDVAKREKSAEDKLRRADNLVLEAREFRIQRPSRVLQEQPLPVRNVPSPTQPCISKNRREVTPRKSVHFDEKRRFSDENRVVRRERLFQDLNSKMDDLDLKDRIHRARMRELDAKVDSRYKSRQLLGLR